MNRLEGGLISLTNKRGLTTTTATVLCPFFRPTQVRLYQKKDAPILDFSIVHGGCWKLEFCHSHLSPYDHKLTCSVCTDDRRELNIPSQDFMSDAIPAAILPVYPSLGLAHNFDCTLRSLVTRQGLVYTLSFV